MTRTDLGGGLGARFRNLAFAPLAIYGLLVYTVLIGVVADEDDDLWEIFIDTTVSQIVFFFAHVFAHTLGTHAEHGLRGAIRHAVRHAAAMLYAAAPPALILGVGAVINHHNPDPFVNAAATVSVVILGVLGFFAYAGRTRNIALRLLGALGTAALGTVIILFEYALH